MKNTTQCPLKTAKRALVTGLCCAWFTGGVWASGEAPAAVQVSPDPAETVVVSRQDGETLAKRWGIEIVGLRLTAAGHMIDFRYKIIDSEKAVALMDRDDEPVLIHQGSGKMTGVPVPPKVGRLRQRSNEPKLGRHYFMLFANPGRYFEAGDVVTIEVGGFRAENLRVEG